jgi:hypothetical protein
MVSASGFISVLAGGLLVVLGFVQLVNSMRAPRVIQVGPQTQ